MSQKKIVLVDMDGTIVDFETAFRESANKKGWEISCGKSGSMYFDILGDDQNKSRAREIKTEKEFYLNMKPIEGAVEAIKEIINDENINLFFCSSPLAEHQNCVPEKYLWIEKYFGFESTKKIILTKDKTLVYGDFLIDDKPKISGVNQNPAWEHIHFIQEYNRNLSRKKIYNWKEWKEVLGFDK